MSVEIWWDTLRRAWARSRGFDLGGGATGRERPNTRARPGRNYQGYRRFYGPRATAKAMRDERRAAHPMEVGA